MYHRALVKVLAAHKKHALARGTLACAGDVATLNVTRGCAARCVFCYARCYSGAPEPGTLVVYRDLPAQLRHELDNPRRKSPRPRYVLFASASDAFLGGQHVLHTTRACLDILLRRNIGVSLSTRGLIPDDVVELLGRHHDIVRVTIPIASLSEQYTSSWEPGTATPRERLFMIQRLREVGVEPAVHISPLIPFVNDGNDDLRALLSALVALGVDQAQASFVHLRPGVAEQIEAEAPAGSRRLVLGVFPALASGQPVRFAHIDPQQALSSLRRLQRIAREQGARVSACRCHNPGLPAANCLIEPPSLPEPIAPEPEPSSEQTLLFGEDGDS
ncbi:MAG: radical SAM protein [Myxococcales bacterium]|nr:radical SAM protein [Myxococcales bacterium]